MQHRFSQPSAIPSLAVGPSRRLEEHVDALTGWLGALHSSDAFNGTVLIARNGEILFERHCGFAGLDTRIPLTGSSSFSLASLSKPFTALGILLLVQKGRLTLRDKLAQHIPEFAGYSEATIRHLLHHTSGLPDYVELADDYWNEKSLLTMPDLIALFVKHRPRSYFAPGERFEYSNTGYAFLGEILSRVSGTSYPQFMAEEIFKPLGMNDSAAFNLSSKECPLRSRVFGFRMNFGRKASCDLNFLDGMFGDGGIYASAEDLVRWDRALRDGTLIPCDVYRAAYVSGTLNNGMTTGYGYGWEIEPSNVVEHRGQWEGFTAYMRRDLTQHTLLVVLSNVGPAGRVDPVCKELAAFVAGIAWPDDAAAV